MATITKALYDTDFVEWTAHNAELLRQGRFDEVDLEHVAEEIEDLGKSNFNAVRPQLHRMLTHLIKRKIQPERDGTSWLISINSARREIPNEIRDSPSLHRRLSDRIEDIYDEAIEDALLETGLAGEPADLGIPDRCPFTLAQLLGNRPDLLHF
jgi:hypothetical protein